MDLREGLNSGFEEDDTPAGRSLAESLFLALDGYEGPIDLLLSLARDQKVDLARISIVALADQYLEFISRARQLRLEIAADYLVMAAWLAYLKSRLLLPEPPIDEEEESPEELAVRLAFQLRRLEAMQRAAQQLMAIPRMGQDFYCRGEPQAIKVENTSSFDVSLYDLLKVYGSIHDKMTASTLRIMPTELYSMDDVMGRLRDMLGGGRVPDWSNLVSFLPDNLRHSLVIRSATAATFAASLELAREGLLEIRQNGIFTPIFFRSNPDATVPPLDDRGAENPTPIHALPADLEVE